MILLRFISLCLITIAMGSFELSAQSPRGGEGDLPAFDEGLVRVEIGGAGSWDMAAGFVEDSLYLPFGVLSMPLGLKQTSSRDEDTIVTEFPLGTPIRFIRSAGTVTRRDSIHQLPDGAIREYDGEYYVRYDVLMKSIGIPATFDLRKLKVSIPYDIRIPAVAMAVNRGRYASLNSPTESDRRSNLPTPPKGLLIGSAIVQWSATGSFFGNLYQGGAASASLTGPLLYGTATIGGNARQTGDMQQSMEYQFSHASWTIPVLDFSPLSRVLVMVRPHESGTPDLSLSLSNIRLTRPREVDTRDLSGVTMPQWDVELYEGNRLVDVTRADSLGRYSFTLPVGYGKVQRRMVEVGPHGERIESDHTIGLAAGSLFPGEVQYQADFARVNAEGATRYDGALALRTGVFDWLNLGATADVQTSNLDRTMLDSVDIRPVMNIWLGDMAVVEFQGSPRQKTIGGEVNLNLGMAIGVSVAGQSSFSTRSHSILGSVGLPLGPVGFSTTGGYIETPATISYMLSPRFGTGFGRFSLSAGATMSHVQGQLTSNHGIRSSILSNARAMYRMANWLSLSASGSYDMTNSEIGDWSVGSTTRFAGMDLGMYYSAQGTDWRNGSLEARLTLGLGFASSRTSVDYEQDQVHGTSMLDGAFSISAAGLTLERVGSGAVPTLTIIGFADRNLNGQRDGGEEVFENIRAQLTSSDGATSTTSTGRFSLLRPYIESYIDIDPSSLTEENLAPTRSEYVVLGIPSMRHVIEVPFASGFDVSGTCEVELPNGKRKTSAGVLNGLRVRLVSIGGTAVYNCETFFDGSMISFGVAPGEYRIEFDSEQLAERRIMLREELRTVTIVDREVDLPTIVLVPDPSVN